MKSLFLSAILAVVILSCNSKEEKKFVHSPSDTATYQSVYFSPYYKVYMREALGLIRKDSMMYFNTDSSTMKKGWFRHISYFESINDSIRGADGRPILDTAKKPRFKQFWIPLEQKNIIGIIPVNLDSLARIKTK